MAYGYFVDDVLGKINEETPVKEKPYDRKNEWFQLKSDKLSDDQLYYTLRAKWTKIVGPNYARFALIYCVQRPNPGVWIHSFAASDTPSVFIAGCFKDASWE